MFSFFKKKNDRVTKQCSNCHIDIVNKMYSTDELDKKTQKPLPSFCCLDCVFEFKKRNNSKISF